MNARSFLPNILQHGIWVPTRLALLFFIHLHIKGRENIKNTPRGVIFALNHSSELDPIILPSSFPFLSSHFPMFYTSRERSFYSRSGWRQWLYGGAFFKAWGAYPVNVGKQNYEVALAPHIKILQEDKSLCIFPEGVKTRDGNLQEGRGGATYLSWRTGKPIIPVAICNVWNIGFKNFILRRRFVTISFGAPLYPKDLFVHCRGNPAITEEQNDFSIAAQIVMRKIAELLKQ
ncbi:MAG TPA: lysophospholipid acyltransferase family protein [Candidatus Paceibacterota bacterium]